MIALLGKVVVGRIGFRGEDRFRHCDPMMAALPGYISNHVPRAGTGFSADFGGYPGVALRRLGSTNQGGGLG